LVGIGNLERPKIVSHCCLVRQVVRRALPSLDDDVVEAASDDLGDLFRVERRPFTPVGQYMSEFGVVIAAGCTSEEQATGSGW